MPHQRSSTLVVFTFFVALGRLAWAEVLRVGPGEAFTRIADAARHAKDGDTVEIAPGTYRGDVATWRQNNLTLRGIGNGPVLHAAGKSAQDKAIWVIRGDNVVVDNIEFRGARVPDHNGAGIRFEKGSLTVRNSRFIDNETGILTSNNATDRLRIEDSLFECAPHHPGALHHLLYVGQIESFHLSGSRFHGGYHAHLVKSRARYNRIEYNLIYDGDEGQASYELEFPNGGEAVVIGNIIGQGAKTSNQDLVSFGAEGYPHVNNQITLVHNTLLSDRGAGTRFLRIWQHPNRNLPTVHARNNLLIGLGIFELGNPGVFEGTFRVPALALGDIDALDFSLSNSSPWHGRASVPDDTDGEQLRPMEEFRLPIGTRRLSPPERWSPGAIQAPGLP